MKKIIIVCSLLCVCLLLTGCKKLKSTQKNLTELEMFNVIQSSFPQYIDDDFYKDYYFEYKDKKELERCVSWLDTCFKYETLEDAYDYHVNMVRKNDGRVITCFSVNDEYYNGKQLVTASAVEISC